MDHTIDAYKIARCVRGCATDSQFMDLITNIETAFLALTNHAVLLNKMLGEAEARVLELTEANRQLRKRDF